MTIGLWSSGPLASPERRRALLEFSFTVGGSVFCSTTKAMFAFRCELDRTYIGGIERGLRNPTLASVRKIARGLGVSMVALVRDVE